VDLATNCYGCHVLQKALDCEEDIRLCIVSELLRGDPASTLVNKHASHVWSKVNMPIVDVDHPLTLVSQVMELTWTPPAPPIFAWYVLLVISRWARLTRLSINRSLHGQWAQLACHETGSLVVQHAFENLEDTAKAEIIEELLNRGPRVFGDIVKNQWGAYCIQHSQSFLGLHTA
jgi:pumilio RNA-binding family